MGTNDKNEATVQESRCTIIIMMSLLLFMQVFLFIVAALAFKNNYYGVDAFAFHHQSVVVNHHRILSSTSSSASSLLQATTNNNENNNNNNNDINNNNNKKKKNEVELQSLSRRSMFAKTVSTVAAASMGMVTSGIVHFGEVNELTGGGPSLRIPTLSLSHPQVESANAIGPVKINLLNPTYTAIPCPKDKPIPGEKAMKGMRGLCVTVNVDLEESPAVALSQVGVYGYITDKGTAESVLANNPDGGTDAGQFAMIDAITTTDKNISFEFIAAVPSEQDLTPYDEGIAPILFKSLRVVSFPGGQQYGKISPCEMNEFSDECAAWEDENGAYVKKEYMIKSNPRTKGR